MTAPFGKPSDVQVRSMVSTVVAQPAGAQRGTTPLNQAPGSALSGENYIVRDGALELRPALSRTTGPINTSNPWSTKRPVGGGWELYNIGQAPIAHALQYNEFATSVAGDGWQAAAMLSNDTVMRGDAQTKWDTTQAFNGTNNDVVATPDTQQAIFKLTGNSYKFLTNLIGAKRVVAFDNYVVVGNVYEYSSALSYSQRVQWSDRGSSSSWTGGLSGFEDLYAARGEIQRLIALENRIIVLFDDEIWQGLPADFPFTFRFSPVDQGVGCPYPWTATATPRGVMFMARDYQMYLLPKEGGAAQPVGAAIQRKVRSDITWPDRAFGVYDPNMQQYEMFYCASSDSYPRNAAFMDINSGAWSFQSFPVPLTTGLLIHERGALVPVLPSSTGTMYRLTSDYTQDTVSATTLSINAYWEFMPFGGEVPPAQKTITEVRVDYDCATTSKLTVRTSSANGDAFSAGTQLTLPAASVVSQAVAHVFETSRYPVVRLEQESQRERVHRVHVTARIGGR